MQFEGELELRKNAPVAIADVPRSSVLRRSKKAAFAFISVPITEALHSSPQGEARRGQWKFLRLFLLVIAPHHVYMMNKFLREPKLFNSFANEKSFVQIRGRSVCLN